MQGRRGPKRTPELVEKAKALHAGGASFEAIAWHLSVSYDTARGWIDPKYAESKRARVNRNRRMARLERRSKAAAAPGYSLYGGKP